MRRRNGFSKGGPGKDRLALVLRLLPRVFSMVGDSQMKRTLLPELKAWFDVQCLNPPSPSFQSKNFVLMLLSTALQCRGITEVGADNHGHMVELFQSTMGHAEGEPWCMAFLQSCVAYVETFGFDSGLFPTEHCLTAFTNSKCLHPVEPVAGDIIIWQLDGTTRGHCGLITSVQTNWLHTIEGNTSPATGEIERNGDGVYEKIRPRGGMGKMREIGYLRPFVNLGF